MSDHHNDLNMTVRNLVKRVENEWDFVVNDDDGNPCLVVLPLAHFHRLRDKADDKGWWDLRNSIAEEIQLAMGLPEDPTIRDLIAFGQR
jgi:hypothetical protein